ncbi:putative thioredoxin protein [endosymbiont of Acanthamoeba sp. UWC8]|nr:putative thioredoxin protein [endosymbiont of Acanthamoeba sp. UWC8]
MFNKILKKLLLRFVTNFLYISTFFFVCTLIFAIEFGFNCISVAKASPIDIQKSKRGIEVNKMLEAGILKRKIEVPRAQIFNKDGSAHLLKEFKNKFVVLYIWASWCTDCINELTKLDQLARELKYREVDDIVILPITIDFKSPQQLQIFLKQRNIENIDFFLDPKKEIMGELGVHSLPSSFLINKNGYIIASYKRPLDWSNEVVLEKILNMKEENEKPVKSRPNNNEILKEDDKNKSKDIIPQINSKKTEKQPTFIG